MSAKEQQIVKQDGRSVNLNVIFSEMIKWNGRFFVLLKTEFKSGSRLTNL